MNIFKSIDNIIDNYKTQSLKIYKDNNNVYFYNITDHKNHQRIKNTICSRSTFWIIIGISTSSSWFSAKILVKLPES